MIFPYAKQESPHFVTLKNSLQPNSQLGKSAEECGAG